MNQNVKAVKRYAQALFRLAHDEKNEEAVYKESLLLIDAINQSRELNLFLINPIIASSQRIEILKNIFEKKIHQSLFRFICFLEQKKRLSLLKDILEQYEEFYLDSKNILKATITGPYELTKEDLSSVTQYLTSRFKKEILPQTKVNPDVLGGIKIQIGDVIYDYSVATQLKRFKDNILFN